jgi:hypothetical protein
MSIKRLMIYVLVLSFGMHFTANANEPDTFSELEIGPIAMPAGKPYTIVQIKKAIIYATRRHNWVIESETPGSTRIKIDGRKDGIVLVMDIFYDENKYSLKYVDGVLPVKERKIAVGTTYRNVKPNSPYSRWVKNLTDAINVELVIVNL